MAGEEGINHHPDLNLVDAVTKSTKQPQHIRGQKRGRQPDREAIQQVRELLGDAPRRRDLLIEHLHAIQDHYHQISAQQLQALAIEMNLSQVEVYEVASFYQHFDLLEDSAELSNTVVLRVCDSLSCRLAGAGDLMTQLGDGSGKNVRLVKASCMGRCDLAPVAMLGTNPITQANPQKLLAAIGSEEFQAGALQDYIDLGAYQDRQGYVLYRRCIEGDFSIEDIIDRLQRSGLRGLGGAGFPAARKWRILRQQPGDRVLVVNIDEGEPGTFKDRFYLERDPHRMLEGALIAAWAIGANAVYLYLRDEYASIHRMLSTEIEKLQRAIEIPLPDIHLRRGAGSYVCGEESALIESLEGKRGMPRLRPPYIAEKGLFGNPTLAHNMETLYWVRDIIEKGPKWFSKQDSDGRQGLRSFSISGRVKNPGVYRAPAGITLTELIDDHCGGMQDGHRLYGYFPGGASGGMLPASMADVPLDFDTLQSYGCFIGSAAIIIFSESDSARDLALNAMQFFARESCGQCTPCRMGTAKAVELMQQKQWDSELLHELSAVMSDASICGLGQAAPNPLLCAMKYFPQEFES